MKPEEGPLRRDNYCAHPAYVESFGNAQYIGTNEVVDAPAPVVVDCLMQVEGTPLEVWEAVRVNLEFWANAPLRQIDMAQEKWLRETRCERMEYGK
jgi:hypothetical protein